MLKKILSILISGLFVLVVAGTSIGASPAEVESAIEDGLSWLANQQQPDGSWAGAYPVGITAHVVLAFELQGYLPGDSSAYAQAVEDGLDYIFANAQTMGISPQPAGDPDSDGDGIAVFFGTTPIYETGVVVQAVATSSVPDSIVNVLGSAVNGWTYEEVLEDCLDYCAFSQNEGAGRGGWRYFPNYLNSDNSASQWPVLGMAAAETLFGLSVPQFVRGELELWVDFIQEDTTGGSGYTFPATWMLNVARTGGLLIEFAFLGDGPSASRVEEALGYISNNWGTDNEGNGYAMRAVAEGCRLLGVDVLPGDIDWYEEYSDYLVASQQADGSWPRQGWGEYSASAELDTAWAVIVLTPPAPAVLMVEIDIKPGSINLGSKGVITVAILSSEDFDATEIDPETVQLAGAGVAARGKKGKLMAHEEDINGDGLLDLVVQVETENLDAAQLQDDSACLTGETYGGQLIKGCDEVKIVPPNKPAPSGRLVVEALAPYPQPSNPETWIPYKLAKGAEVTITIYNVPGQVIKTLYMGYKPVGSYLSKDRAAYWDGKNDKGEEVASGLYMYAIQAGDLTVTRKIVIRR